MVDSAAAPIGFFSKKLSEQQIKDSTFDHHRPMKPALLNLSMKKTNNPQTFTKKNVPSNSSGSKEPQDEVRTSSGRRVKFAKNPDCIYY